MKNTYRIIWSDEALNGLKEIISYIEKKFSEKEVRNFVKKVDKQISIIKAHPQTFPISKKSKSIRRAVVAKLTSIYFSFDEDTIKLISIFDNRKNPKKFKF